MSIAAKFVIVTTFVMALVVGGGTFIPKTAYADSCTNSNWVTEAQATDQSNSQVHQTVILQKKSVCNVWRVVNSVWISSNYRDPNNGSSSLQIDSHLQIPAGVTTNTWVYGPGSYLFYGTWIANSCAWGSVDTKSPFYAPSLTTYASTNGYIGTC